MPRRSPHGERGLKLPGAQHSGLRLKSLPAWGAWIEITTGKAKAYLILSRSPHGERGLKYPSDTPPNLTFSRSPHGERGLKFFPARGDLGSQQVAPRMGSVD